MKADNSVSVQEFCVHYHIDTSFIETLHEFGLIEVIEVEQHLFLPVDQLPQLEKFVRLHYDMNINIEGIETITHLLDRVESLQRNIAELKNRIRRYEDE
jgi:chaperone modulatory protein CbpM